MYSTKPFPMQQNAKSAKTVNYLRSVSKCTSLYKITIVYISTRILLENLPVRNQYGGVMSLALTYRQITQNRSCIVV